MCAWNEVLPSKAIETQYTLPQTGDKPLIAILLPHRGSLSAEFVERTWGPLRHRPLDWCNKIFFLCRVPSLPLARNMLVRQAVASKADFVLWIDADHTVESPVVQYPSGEQIGDVNEALRALYEVLEQTKESIVTGLYIAKQSHGFNYAIWKKIIQPDGKIGFVHIDSWEGNWFEVDVHGLGLSMMRRCVLEDLMKKYEEDGMEPFHWETPEEMSEDFFMLMRARELGYKTWCYSDVRLAHIGEMVVETQPEEIECPRCKEKIHIRKFRVPIV